MRRRTPTWLLLLLAGSLWFVVSLKGTGGQRVSINAGEGPLERCDQLDISFDDRPARRGEETLRIPAGTGPLDVRVAHHGGIGLRESPGREHEITLCKAVPARDSADPAAVRAVVSESSVEVSGPADSLWVGYLLVRSPRGSHVSLTSRNGPVRVDGFDGRLTVQTTNGPIALSQVRGTTAARAVNGPIKLRGEGGQVTLATENGPIDVRLLGQRWQSGELKVTAQNGPVAIALPADYRSGVEIASAGHAPWSCRGVAGCGTRGTGIERHRRLVLGEGSTQVRLSTVNGPVKVLTTDRE